MQYESTTWGLTITRVRKTSFDPQDNPPSASTDLPGDRWGKGKIDERLDIPNIYRNGVLGR